MVTIFDDFAGLFNLSGGHFAQADVANLALLLHALEGSQALFERRTRVDAVKLVEVDALQPEPPQAHFNALDEIAGTAHAFGFGGSLARNAALGGDHQAGRIGVEHVADQPLGNLGTVSIGRINERDAQFDGAVQNAAGLGGFAGLAPRAFAHQAHGSVTETMNGQIAADEECAAGSRGWNLWVHVLFRCAPAPEGVEQCLGHP